MWDVDKSIVGYNEGHCYSSIVFFSFLTVYWHRELWMEIHKLIHCFKNTKNLNNEVNEGISEFPCT